jgi:hypothetical protein
MSFDACDFDLERITNNFWDPKKKQILMESVGTRNHFENYYIFMNGAFPVMLIYTKKLTFLNQASSRGLVVKAEDS